jgi:hypothetical protein
MQEMTFFNSEKNLNLTFNEHFFYPKIIYYVLEIFVYCVDNVTQNCVNLRKFMISTFFNAVK